DLFTCVAPLTGHPARSPPFPYTPLFRSIVLNGDHLNGVTFGGHDGASAIAFNGDIFIGNAPHLGGDGAANIAFNGDIFSGKIVQIGNADSSTPFNREQLLPSIALNSKGA